MHTQEWNPVQAKANVEPRIAWRKETVGEVKSDFDFAYDVDIAYVPGGVVRRRRVVRAGLDRVPLENRGTRCDG